MQVNNNATAQGQNTAIQPQMTTRITYKSVDDSNLIRALACPFRTLFPCLRAAPDHYATVNEMGKKGWQMQNDFTLGSNFREVTFSKIQPIQNPPA